MKTRPLFVFSVLFVATLSGCSNIPKDSITRGLDIGATPWTPTVKAELIATGKAASNLTAEERRELLAPKK